MPGSPEPSPLRNLCKQVIEELVVLMLHVGASLPYAVHGICVYGAGGGSQMSHNFLWRVILSSFTSLKETCLFFWMLLKFSFCFCFLFSIFSLMCLRVVLYRSFWICGLILFVSLEKYFFFFSFLCVFSSVGLFFLCLFLSSPFYLILGLTGNFWLNAWPCI